jgi:dihydroorotase-like cyclic amidohydrolase
MTDRVVIRNGFVISMDADVGEVPFADVVVEDGRIAAVGQGLDVSEAEEVDATGMLVLPGFATEPAATEPAATEPAATEPAEATATAASGEPVRIGLLSSFTGPFTPWGIQVRCRCSSPCS